MSNTLSVLPEDVLHPILALLRPKDLASVARTTQSLHFLATQYLYKKVTIGHNADVPATVNFLINHPDVAARVRTLEITHHRNCTLTACPLLPRLPNLHSFVLDIAHPLSDSGVKTLNTCLAGRKGGTKKRSGVGDTWEFGPRLNVCALAINQSPLAVVVRLFGRGLSEVLFGWEGLFPFLPTNVQQLVVVTDMNRPSGFRCESLKYMQS